jgi:GTP-binding protein HflX
MSADGRPEPAPEAGDGAANGRALVLHPYAAGDHVAANAAVSRLAEAVGLAEALGLAVLGADAVPLRRRSPATLMGGGKVEELHSRIAAAAVELVVVDAALSPVQQRNLERRWQAKVIDRTALILEIFGARAKTREGVLQVELAALTYQRSRLVRSWTHLERQRGGYGFLGGPGESQIELDRRRIGTRIAQLRRELDDVRRTRGLHREARARVPYPVLVLVGYTNAGKSTLFNRLTGAAVAARDQLFATLDPTMRLVVLPSGTRAILSDTVGFISDLPTTLIAAFRATLEEVVAADMILHVRDISHPESERQRRDVLQVLGELGLDEARLEGRLIEVWNKVDRLDAEARRSVEAAASRQDAVPTSATLGDGMAELLALIDRRRADRREPIELDVPYGDGALLAWLHEHGKVLERADGADTIHLRVALDPATRARLDRRLERAR